MTLIRGGKENGGLNLSCQICFYLIMLLADGRFTHCWVLRFGAHALSVLLSLPFETDGGNQI